TRDAHSSVAAGCDLRCDRFVSADVIDPLYVAVLVVFYDVGIARVVRKTLYGTTKSHHGHVVAIVAVKSSLSLHPARHMGIVVGVHGDLVRGGVDGGHVCLTPLKLPSGVAVHKEHVPSPCPGDYIQRCI